MGGPSVLNIRVILCQYAVCSYFMHWCIILILQFVRRDGSPYALGNCDMFSCRVVSTVDIPYVVEPAQIVGQSSIKVSFTAKTSGKYTIVLKVNDELIGGTQIVRKYLPGV